MTYETLTFELCEGLAVLTLNQPDSLNAFSAKMKEELLAVFTDLSSETSTARALIITGSGRGFCAGADLTETGSKASLEVLLNETYHPFLRALRGLEIPVITAVNGVAAGAGLSLALHGDLIVASDKASFLMAFVRIGLVPDAGGSFLLPRLIGEARARRMMMLGEQIDAQTAYDWGMVTHLVPADSLMETATKLGIQFATGPTRSLAGIRTLLQSSSDNSYEEQLSLEAKVQGTLGASADFKEGATAFLEKRKAVFTGK